MADANDTQNTTASEQTVKLVKLFSANPLTDPNAEELGFKVPAENVVDKNNNPVFGDTDITNGFVFVGDDTGENAGVENTPSDSLVDSNDPTKLYVVDNISPGTEENDAIWTAKKILEEIRRFTLFQDEAGDYWKFGAKDGVPGIVKVDANGNPIPDTPTP